MKKFIIIVILIAAVTIGYVVYVETTKDKEIPLVAELEKATINEYYIYGTTLNIKGSLTVENISFDEIDLVLYNKDLKLEKKDTIDKRFITIPIKYEQIENTINFTLSDLINEGLYLDDLEVSNYNMFIRTTHKEETSEEEKITYKYYSLDNITEYKETTYYTMGKYNRKIVINSNNDYQTMMFNVTENKDKEIYDIVIDAGHGGMDPGAVINGEKESIYTLEIALKLKDKLKESGLKVKLTRDEGSLAENEYFNEYGKGGRAQISHEVYAKYLLSIHLNKNTSTSVRGIELYTPSNINYDFAKNLVEEIVNTTSIEYSNRKTFKMFNGVYTHNFTEDEIQTAMEGYANKNYVPYDVTTESSYLYMIRETGGIMTGAYVDNRNKEQTGNDYYNSNIGTESYLLELSYLSNPNDLIIIKQEQDKYVEAIAKSIITNFDK